MPVFAARRGVLAGAALVLLVVAAEPAPGTAAARADAGQAPEARVNRDAQLIADFTRRVQEYVEIHTKADSTLSEFPKSATKEQVDSHRRALGQLIGRARANAKQGDIFAREIRAYFRRQIGRALGGPDGAGVKAAMMEDNPGPIKLRINGTYPVTLPVTTMPPQVLAALPRLPTVIEYRFIGERLVLLDVHGQLVVDYMDDAIPN
jgi:hypothetical protein